MEEKSSTMTSLSSSMNFTNISLCLVLLGISLYILKKWMKSSGSGRNPSPGYKMLPKMKRQDFYLHQLAPYNGVQNERILIAVNFNIFDVSNRGRDFYGPGGPYNCFAGRDASRALANMSLADSDIKEEFDDLKDLDNSQMDQLKEWEMQFKEKYFLVGRLLKPEEKPTDYSESDDA